MYDSNCMNQICMVFELDTHCKIYVDEHIKNDDI